MKSVSHQIEGAKRQLESNTEFPDVKILFGHKSVGANIMNGVTNIVSGNPNFQLIITDQDSLLTSHSSVFYHYKNGENKLPFGKIDSFYTALSRNHRVISIAFVKFCYADIIYSTDVKKLFMYYKEKMTQIENEFPGIRLIHFTVPLNTKPKGMKGYVKSIIGWDSNHTREEFNNMIRTNYPEQRVFDLAKHESTYDNDTFEKSFTGTPALRPDLTTDGGHLNETGKEYIGILLLLKIKAVATE